MRALFIKAIVVLGLYGCGTNSYQVGNTTGTTTNSASVESTKKVAETVSWQWNDSIADFRDPIYLVPDEESFWSGCPDLSTTAGEECKESRRQIIDKGINQWLTYFPQSTAPVIVVDRGQPMPLTSNRLIPFKVDAKGCPDVVVQCGATLLACYEPKVHEIVFIKPEYIEAHVVAHELGHAWGIPHSDYFNKGCASPLMSTPVQSDHVTDLDVQFLCRTHAELDCPIDEGSFYETMLDTVSCPKFWEPPQEVKCN